MSNVWTKEIWSEYSCVYSFIDPFIPSLTENLGRTYEITVTQEKEAEDRRWRVDTDKFMGGR